jgi:hypothetical protein
MKPIAVVALATALALSGCASSGTASKNAATGSVPSAAARLVCSNDTVSDISVALGVGVTKPLAPTWADNTYTCDYVFAAGVMVLSVTDHPDSSAATVAFTAGQPAGAAAVPGVGQQAYADPAGDMVLRKDASILTVDVSGLPATFGVPPHPRNVDAITVADTVLACWTEDS